MTEETKPFDQAIELAALRSERTQLANLLTAYQAENAAVRAEILRLSHEVRRKGLTKSETWMMVIIWLFTFGIIFLGSAHAIAIRKELRQARRLQEAQAVKAGFTPDDIERIYRDQSSPLEVDEPD